MKRCGGVVKGRDRLGMIEMGQGGVVGGWVVGWNRWGEWGRVGCFGGGWDRRGVMGCGWGGELIPKCN